MPPSNPRDVVAVQVGPTHATVSWNVPQISAGGSIVAYRVSGVPDTGITQTPALTRAVTVFGLQPGVTYYFLVRSVGANGLLSAGTLSNALTMHPLAPASTIVTGSVPTPPPATQPATTQPANVGLPLPLPNVPSPAGVPKPCVPVRWPSYAAGTPANFRTGAGSGVYIWWDGRYWNVRTYNTGPAPVVFSGSVNANASIRTYSYLLEKGSDVLRKNSKSLTFSFRSNYDVDAIKIAASCATLLSMRFFVNGAAVPLSQIFVGTRARNPSSQPVVIIR